MKSAIQFPSGSNDRQTLLLRLRRSGNFVTAVAFAVAGLARPVVKLGPGLETHLCGLWHQGATDGVREAASP